MRKFSSEIIQNEVLTINSENPYCEDNFERKSQAKISPYGQSFEEQEEEFIYFKEEHHYELETNSSGPIQNWLININYEHPSSEDHFERKSQAKISSSDKILEKQEE